MIFLLELRLGSELFRLATVSTSVASDDGALLYDGGLMDVGWERLFRMSTGAPPNDVPVEIGPGAIDVPSLLDAGTDVGDGFGELSRLLPGRTYEQREVMHSGRVSELQYDEPSEPVAFALLAVDNRFTKLVPQRDAVLDYTGIPDAVLGDVAPIVFGEPTYDESGASFLTGSGSFAHAAETPGVLNGVIIASELVDATTVDLAYHRDPQKREWVTHTVYTGPDTSVNVDYPHAYVKLESTLFLKDPESSGSGDERWTRFLVRWNNGAGVLRPTTHEPVRTAGELIEYLLWKGGNVDRGRTAAAVGHLPIKLDGYIDERVDPIDWIQDNLLPILPVSIVSGPDGMYPVVARPYLDPTLPVLELTTERRDIYPATAVVYDGSDDIRNDITVHHRFDAGERKTLRRARHTGDPDVAVGDRVAKSSTSKASWGRYGERPHEITSRIVYRTSSAHQIAAWMVRRYGFPSRVTTYILDPKFSTGQFLAALEPGSGVRIVDTIRSINELCVIESISADLDGEHRITVRTVELT